MAKYEEYAKTDGEDKQEPVEPTDSLAAIETEESPPNVADNEVKEEVLPDKYQGKTIAELARMHQEAESVIGRQGNEMGELRSTVDKLIDANLQPAQQQDEATEPEGVDFYADPIKSVNDLVDTHPVVKKAAETTARMEKHAAQQTLLAKHPDLDSIFEEPEFREWIAASPHRQAQLSKADKDFDVDSGDALLTDYKEIKALKTKSPPQQKAPKPDIKAASTGAVKGGGGSTRQGKLLYRADIRKLQREDPRRYNEMLPVIRKAYAEGRVRKN